MNQQLLVSIIDSIHETKGHYPGKKELQKTVYLLQNKGLDLGYSYRFYFYGPYSDALDEDIQRLAIQGIVSIKHEEMTHRITVKDRPQGPKVKPNDLALVQATADELKSLAPVQLELMTTILFVINNKMVPVSHSEDDIVQKVLEVKGDKYSEAEIRGCYSALGKKKYIH